MKYPTEILAKAKKIKLAIFDVDGVLTDGRLYFDAQGNEMKVFHVHDGLGMKFLQGSGVPIAIISGRTAPAVSERLSKLGIELIYQGHEDKLPILNQLLIQLKLSPDEVVYVGDDLIDIPVLQRVGLAIAVANAPTVLTQHTHWQTQNAVGYGAVREVCDLILTAQEKLEKIYNRYAN
jgi:3-deoxy-D-manno-octulosonate 8-phosphate phosphatase (KDO 8-P phosphatase)